MEEAKPKTPAAEAGLVLKTGRRRVLATAAYAGAAALAGGAGFWLWQQKTGESSSRSGELQGKTGYHPLSAVNLQNLDGQALDLQPYLQARVLVLNFWAPWCPPCVEELPLIDAKWAVIAVKPTKKIELLAIALDDLAPVQRFWRARNWQATVPAVVGYAGMELMRALGNSTGQLPYTVVLGADGAILRSHLGALKAADVQQILAFAQQAAQT